MFCLGSSSFINRSHYTSIGEVGSSAVQMIDSSLSIHGRSNRNTAQSHRRRLSAERRTNPAFAWIGGGHSVSIPPRIRPFESAFFMVAISRVCGNLRRLLRWLVARPPEGVQESETP